MFLNTMYLCNLAVKLLPTCASLCVLELVLIVWRKTIQIIGRGAAFKSVFSLSHTLRWKWNVGPYPRRVYFGNTILIAYIGFFPKITVRFHVWNILIIQGGERHMSGVESQNSSQCLPLLLPSTITNNPLFPLYILASLMLTVQQKKLLK